MERWNKEDWDQASKYFHEYKTQNPGVTNKETMVYVLSQFKGDKMKAPCNSLQSKLSKRYQESFGQKAILSVGQKRKPKSKKFTKQVKKVTTDMGIKTPDELPEEIERLPDLLYGLGVAIVSIVRLNKNSSDSPDKVKRLIWELLKD